MTLLEMPCVACGLPLMGMYMQTFGAKMKKQTNKQYEMQKAELLSVILSTESNQKVAA